MNFETLVVVRLDRNENLKYSKAHVYAKGSALSVCGKASTMNAFDINPANHFDKKCKICTKAMNGE